jgi:hypothetical protein
MCRHKHQGFQPIGEAALMVVARLSRPGAARAGWELHPAGHAGVVRPRRMHE